MNPLNNLPSAVSGAIPARAGFTPIGRTTSRRWKDHPRSRGVYVGDSQQHDRRLRIIPARAGFTTPGTGWGRPSRDHPRSRGVYPARSSASSTAAGSSPLARGLRPCHGAHAGDDGIIPARAGFTGVHGDGEFGPGDHPRSRGVYRFGPYR